MESLLEFDRIKLNINGNVGTVVLNDPDVLNAASPMMVDGFMEALDVIEYPDTGLRCLIITGEGRGFCSGANLQGRDKPAPSKTGAPRDGGLALEQRFHPLMRRIRNLNMPVITAVNGVAAGVGMSVALMGDLIFCAKSAYFLQAFRRIGLVPDGGSTWLLPRLVGKARAIELSLLGEKLPAEKALEWGLVNRVLDDAVLMDEVNKLATDLANGPTLALKLIRQLYWESPDNSYEQQLNMERQLQKQASASADYAEGVKAFLEKRAAKFQGK